MEKREGYAGGSFGKNLRMDSSSPKRFKVTNSVKYGIRCEIDGPMLMVMRAR